MVIEISASDTLFFRDGKPFSLGVETGADTIFPPAPSVFYGAMRAAALAAQFEKSGNNAIDSDRDVTRDLSVSGAALARGNDLFFPAPADLGVLASVGQPEVFAAMHLIANDGRFPLCPLPFLVSPKKKIGGSQGAFISGDSLAGYLAGNLGRAVPVRDLFVSEPKTGIMKDRATGKAATGMLYQSTMVRPVDSRFVLNLDAVELADSGALRLGGEGKMARWAQVHRELVVPPPKLSGNRFKLYFATPGIFETGWLPPWLNDTFDGEYRGVHMRLIAAALNKAPRIGGFDMQKQEPKPMRDAVAAGAVFYFETDSEQIDQIVELFHGRCISDYDLAKQGFGWIFVGGVV